MHACMTHGKLKGVSCGGANLKHKPELQSGPGLLLVSVLGFALGQSCYMLTLGSVQTTNLC